MATNTEQTDASGSQPTSGSGSSHGARGSRRRFMGVAASGVGVLLAVQARSALGSGICQSPSAMVSGNTSPRPNEEPCSGGRSPGFWKQPQWFDSAWAAASATPPTFTEPVGECFTGLSDLTPEDITAPGTLVSTVFGTVPATINVLTTGLWEVLAFPTSFGPDGQLMRHLIAAWLNAGLFPDYPITRSQVLDMWASTVIGGGLYCPLGGVICNDATGLDKTELIDYISGMYDINASFEGKICKASSATVTNPKKGARKNP